LFSRFTEIEFNAISVAFRGILSSVLEGSRDRRETAAW
jgi:hypothetical protein